MAKKLEFDLIESSEYEGFLPSVNEKLEQGWKLHGGMMALTDVSNPEGIKSIRYLQAFTRKADKNNGHT
ncbi:hypothetical protein V9K67_15570 [Paraflavisolibacter sp. H34]|uniref:hypothetical protein n=1 Tax=Huijunlia imazamoxiresistens TaxID=3127457 RepID=UPI0030194FE5